MTSNRGRTSTIYPRERSVAADLEAQLEYVRQRLPANVTRERDGLWYVVWSHEVPPPWQPSTIQMIVQLPPTFPAQAPSGFDVVMPIAVASGGGLGGTGQRQILERNCLHFCWNPNGGLDYTDESGIWRFAKFAETRFLLPQ